MCLPTWSLIVSFAAGLATMLIFWLYLAKVTLSHRPWQGEADISRDNWDPCDDLDSCDEPDEPCDYTVFGGNGDGTISAGEL